MWNFKVPHRSWLSKTVYKNGDDILTAAPTTGQLEENMFETEKTGSAAEGFLRRKPKSLLPNSMEREVKWRSMLEERTTNKRANKPGKNSSEKCKPGVTLQDTTGRKKQWIETGIIEQARISDDGTNQSFILTLDKGGSCLRNMRHIKHLRDTTITNSDNETQPNPPYTNTRGRRRGK